MLGPMSPCIGKLNRNEAVKLFQNPKKEEYKCLYILALDVSMGHSYRCPIQKTTPAYLKTRSNTLKEDFMHYSKRSSTCLERPLIVLKQRDLFQTSRKVLSRSSLFLLFVKPVRSEKSRWKKTPLRSWKTDKSDAHRLAQTHLKTSTSAKRSTKQFLLRDARFSPFYQEIEKKITRLRMDLHNCLQLTFPELEQFFSNRLTPYALTLIRLFLPIQIFCIGIYSTKIKNK